MADIFYRDPAVRYPTRPTAALRPLAAGLITVGGVVLAMGCLVTLFGSGGGPRPLHAGVLLLGVGGIVAALTLLGRNTARGAPTAPEAGVPASLSAGPAARRVRRHRRFVPRHRATTLTTVDGRQIAARIIDLSMGGVAVEADLSPLAFATVTKVGARDAGPVRRTDQGAMFAFAALLDPLDFGDEIVL